MSEMTVVTRNLPTASIVAYLPEGSQLMAVVGLLESFEAANRFREARGRGAPYATRVVGARDRVTTAGALVVAPTTAVDLDVHTLVIAGSLALADAPLPPDALRPVRALAERAERIVGVCAGSFVLGQLGLLDGRRCTTHWLGLDALAARHPTAIVDRDAIFVPDTVGDRPMWTSAGATAGIDLALHLIATDHGPGLARAVARALVVPLRRSGGQSQFSPATHTTSSADDRLQRLVSDVIAAPDGDHRVGALARRVGMSPRNFARVFTRQTGRTPGAFVADVRVDAAKRLLVLSDAGLDSVAQAVGWAHADTLRRAFVDRVGVSPAEYRARFSP